MAQRDSVEAGTGAGTRCPFRVHPPPGLSSWTCPVSRSLGCPARPRLRRRRGACDRQAGSRRCEGESGSGSVMKVVGHWGCWTLRWKAPDCPSCCPGDGKSRRKMEPTMMFGNIEMSKHFKGTFQQFSITLPQCCTTSERQKNGKQKWPNCLVSSTLWLNLNTELSLPLISQTLKC